MKTHLGTADVAKIILALTFAVQAPTVSGIPTQLEQPTRSVDKITSLSPIALAETHSTTATAAHSTITIANSDSLEEATRPTTSHEKLIGEIRQWGLLEANWDGEGAASPLIQSMKEAVSFVRLLNDDIMLPEPMLLASGHAGLYWNTNNLYADIEFLGDGRISYFIKNSEDKHKGVLAFNSEKMPAVFPALLKG